LLPFANVLLFARARSRLFSGFPGISLGCTRTHLYVRTCACVSLSWYRHTQLVFGGGLAPLAAQRVDGTGTEQKGGPPLGRALAWPQPLACKVRSGALGGTSFLLVFLKKNHTEISYLFFRRLKTVFPYAKSRLASRNPVSPSLPCLRLKEPHASPAPLSTRG
jgi:hypothetical protein